jgi:folate-dependent phosphoribosylglycinamide formyltransferase PurN
MKITVFTSNQPRHLSLCESLASIADECYAVIEANTVFPGEVADFFKKSDTFQSYFSGVIKAEKKLFGDVHFMRGIHNIVVKSGDLNMLDRSVLEPALHSDVYVVFGASYIKGWLIDFLVKNKALNIHMGISPYYRGSSCNFWSLYDDNPHLMGATMHLLSRGLDSGNMLYHIAPCTTGCSNVFEFTMASVKSAHQSLVARISDGSIFQYEPTRQDKDLQVRYTRNQDFTDEVAKAFLSREPTIEHIKQLLLRKSEEVSLLRPFYAKSCNNEALVVAID